MKKPTPPNSLRAITAVPARALLAGCLFLSCCSSFQDVRDLTEIQNTPGFYPKALYYSGSDDMGHYFEQESPLADMTMVSKSVKTFMVSRQAVTIPEGAEFPRDSYTGRQDERRRKMLLKTDSPQARRGWAEYPVYDDDRA
jgi:hypothetical protein